jgi:hypothetical protein
VQSLAIADPFDENTDRGTRVVDVSIGSTIDLLELERLDEALRLGVVVRIADAAHARLDVMPLEQFGAVATRVLHTAIGVVDQGAGRRLARNRTSPDFAFGPWD